MTNHDYTAFDPAKWVAVAWGDLKFGVLDRLVAKDSKRRKVVHEGDQRKKGKRKKLKVTDPWKDFVGFEVLLGCRTTVWTRSRPTFGGGL